jgi:hypothetical protein
MSKRTASLVEDSISTKEIQCTKFGMNNTVPQGQTSGANQAECPAGGTGAAAGGWDTAAHRDEAILLINEIRAALIANGIIKGSA